MNKETAGIWLVIGALLALWLYNTGRAQAVLAVIKDPTYHQPSGGTGAGGAAHGGGSGSDGSGGTTPDELSACAAAIAAGVFAPACMDAWKGLNSPEDILGTIGGALSGIFGGIHW